MDRESSHRSVASRPLLPACLREPGMEGRVCFLQIDPDPSIPFEPGFSPRREMKGSAGLKQKRKRGGEATRLRTRGSPTSPQDLSGDMQM